MDLKRKTKSVYRRSFLAALCLTAGLISLAPISVNANEIHISGGPHYNVIIEYDKPDLLFRREWLSSERRYIKEASSVFNIEISNTEPDGLPAFVTLNIVSAPNFTLTFEFLSGEKDYHINSHEPPFGRHSNQDDESFIFHFNHHTDTEHTVSFVLEPMESSIAILSLHGKLSECDVIDEKFHICNISVNTALYGTAKDISPSLLISDKRDVESEGQEDTDIEPGEDFSYNFDESVVEEVPDNERTDANNEADEDTEKEHETGSEEKSDISAPDTSAESDPEAPPGNENNKQGIEGGLTYYQGELIMNEEN